MKILILTLLATVNCFMPVTNCINDNQCLQINSPVGFTASTGGFEKVDGKCCVSASMCYLPDYQTCSGDGTPMKDVICFKSGQVPCAGSCCPTHDFKCEVYEEKNGVKASKCIPTMGTGLGFWFVALPLMLTLFTIITFLVLLVFAKEMIQSELLNKLAAIFSLLIVFFAIFFYYSQAWKYGVAMAVTSAIGIRTLEGSGNAERFVALFAYLFLFFAILGWGSGNSVIGGWGDGLFDKLANCQQPYSSYFARSSLTSAKWSSKDAAVRAGKNPSLIDTYWGYCDEGWLFTLQFFTILQLFFISFMLVSMARRIYQHNATAPSGLKEPLLH